MTHRLAFLHQNLTQMAVARPNPETMVDFDHASVTAVPAGENHNAGSGGVDHRLVPRRQIDAGMNGPFLGDRIAALAEPARQPVAVYRRHQGHRLKRRFQRIKPGQLRIQALHSACETVVRRAAGQCNEGAALAQLLRRLDFCEQAVDVQTRHLDDPLGIFDVADRQGIQCLNNAGTRPMNFRQTCQQAGNPLAQGFFRRIERFGIPGLLGKSFHKAAKVRLQLVGTPLFRVQLPLQRRRVHFKLRPFTGNAFVVRLRRGQVVP